MSGDKRWITATIQTDEPAPGKYTVTCECGYTYRGDERAEIPATCLFPVPHRMAVQWFGVGGVASVDIGTTGDER